MQPTFVQRVTKSVTSVTPMCEQASQSSQQATLNSGVLDTDTSIAMMRDCQLAWEQTRKIRRYTYLPTSMLRRAVHSGILVLFLMVISVLVLI